MKNSVSFCLVMMWGSIVISGSIPESHDLESLKNTQLRFRNTHYAVIIWILFLYNHFAKQKENMLMRKKVTIDFNVLSRIEDLMAERNMTEKEQLVSRESADIYTDYSGFPAHPGRS